MIRGGSWSEVSLPVPAQDSAWKPTAATRDFDSVRSSAAASNDELIGLLAESIAADRAPQASTLANGRLGHSPKTQRSRALVEDACAAGPGITVELAWRALTVAQVKSLPISTSQVRVPPLQLPVAIH